MENSPVNFGSLIGLKPEYRDQYCILHQNTFPGVLEQIRKSNISDYSIFLHDGTLFSHMIYSGSDFKRDMADMGKDETTRGWWKLTDPMQQPFDGRKDGEWWLNMDTWFKFIPETRVNGKCRRSAFSMAIRKEDGSLIPEPDRAAIESVLPAPSKLYAYKNREKAYFYLETPEDTSGDHLISQLKSVLKTDNEAVLMEEVFHTQNDTPESQLPEKKVFVTGCFDLLHSGHIAFLQESAGYGEVHVCIGSDANVELLKGRYPVNSQDERKYMIDALSCVSSCRVNSGWGIIDFEKELRDIMPDIFIVNEDGHTPAKQALCQEMGIEYKVLKRIPHANLPVRSTTALRMECTIPFRIDLAGGWLDQPFVSQYYPGSVITISIEPTVEFNERSGMASSTRRKAIELWRNEIPHGDAEQLARMLFSYENPPGTKEVAGSQDSLGIVLPGLNKLDYNGNYWPETIQPVYEEGILTWLEKKLFLVTLGPRFSSYSVIDNRDITTEKAAALAKATDDCWNAILAKDVQAFGNAFRRSFEAQVDMFPNMADDDIRATIDLYKDKAWGWKLSGAGGGGYLILVAKEPIEGAIQIKIRRKNTL